MASLSCTNLQNAKCSLIHNVTISMLRKMPVSCCCCKLFLQRYCTYQNQVHFTVFLRTLSTDNYVYVYRLEPYLETNGSLKTTIACTGYLFQPSDITVKWPSQNLTKFHSILCLQYKQTFNITLYKIKRMLLVGTPKEEKV